ncbi:unnamed protein product [Didymodactylos carnosus]|uniref:Uncharacterized protein n=1 Tax=Didymodactylos carnosus TaxID=1234261 RepID=A0A8S2CR36_9BILA|nr:unnamed protein product [Didymodactylos carnosus]CAF3563690.1 unnamed protein product [Didymodactylos carnosus]
MDQSLQSSQVSRSYSMATGLTNEQSYNSINLSGAIQNDPGLLAEYIKQQNASKLNTIIPPPTTTSKNQMYTISENIIDEQVTLSSWADYQRNYYDMNLSQTSSEQQAPFRSSQSSYDLRPTK